jgi:CubicO group peptidase (beta-lactamase class C family)
MEHTARHAAVRRPRDFAVPLLCTLLACTGACAGDARAPQSPAAATGARPAVDAAGLAALLDPVFAAGMASEQIPGAAFVLVQDGRVVLAKGYGVADVASGRPVSTDRTIFPIASITKVFTATAVMQLVDRGVVDLHADVNEYLRAVRVPAAYASPVTVEQLLTHTAGFDEPPGRRVSSAAELVPLDRFLSDKLVRVHPPGELTSYSSYGMALAGLLVEDVSGQPFESWLEERLWKPLGMKNTHITVPDGARADLATAYELEDGTLVPVPWEIYQTPPASSISATVDDMSRFMIAHLNNGRVGDARVLSERAAMDMQRQHATMHPKLPGWGLGFQLDDGNGHRVMEHGGDIGGFSALMTLLPDDGVGLYVVHHLEGRNLRFDVKRAVLDRWFPDRRPHIAPAPRAEDALRLARFAGTYRATPWCHTCPGGGAFVQDFEVEANPDGTLTLWDTRWVEIGPLLFASEDGRRKLGFAEDASGRVLALTAGSWRVLERLDRETAR